MTTRMPPGPSGEAASLADLVTEELRQAILAHEFQPGDRLATAALAERFAVSATPVREAFARLAGEGWVSYLPQRGVRVSGISVDEMLEIYELRVILEPMAMRRSVTAGGADYRRRLKRAYELMRDAGGDAVEELDAQAYTAYEDVHVAFHKTALSECGSGWLVRLTDLLADHSRRFRRLSVPLRARYGPIAAEHRAIAEACLDGDADAAVEAVLVHMDNTRRAILEWVGEQPTVQSG